MLLRENRSVVAGAGGGGPVGEMRQGIIKRHKETSGDYRYVHYLDCGEFP